MQKYSSYTTSSIRFRRWSRKGYAVFAGLNKVISIGRVCNSICNMAVLKTSPLSSAEALIASEKVSCSFGNDKEAELRVELPFGELLRFTAGMPMLHTVADCKGAALPECRYSNHHSWSGVYLLLQLFYFKYQPFTYEKKMLFSGHRSHPSLRYEGGNTNPRRGVAST